MANSETLGASFSIDVTELKAGLAQANRLIRESESEFKAAAAGLDDWSQSAEGVQARIKHLNTSTDLQRKKIDALQKEYDRLVADGMDEASKAAVDLRTKINQEKTALGKNEKELQEQTKALDAMGDASEQASNSTEDLGDATEKTSKGLSGIKSAAGFAVKAIAAIAAAAAASAAALLRLSENTRELRTNMAKLETGFTTAGFTAEDATQAYTTLYGVLGDEGKATEAAAHLAKLTNNQVELSRWTDIATGVYATFGDSLPIEGLTEAANETAKTGKLTGVLADALNWAGVNEDDFQEKLDKATTEQERQALITSTLTELYDEQSKSYKSLNKDVIAANRAQAEYSLTLAELGAAAEPLSTQVTNLKTQILSDFAPSIEGLITSLSEMLAGTAGASEVFSQQFGEVLFSITAKITELLPQIVQIAINIIQALVMGILNNLEPILNAAIQIILTVIRGIRDMLPTLVPAIVDAIILIVETVLDNLDMIIDAGMELIFALVDGILAALPRLIDKIPVIVEKFVGAISRNLPKIIEGGIQIIIALAGGIIQAIPQLISKIPEIIAAIVNGLMGGMGDVEGVGSNLVEGLWNGIKSMGSWIGEKIKGFGEGVLNGLKNFFGISSPSKVFRDQIGKNLALGIGEGFEENMKGVNAQITQSIGDIDAEVANGANTARNGLASGQTVNITQNISYNKTQSYADAFKTRQATKAAVRLAMAGG